MQANNEWLGNCNNIFFSISKDNLFNLFDILKCNWEYISYRKNRNLHKMVIVFQRGLFPKESFVA